MNGPGEAPEARDVPRSLRFSRWRRLPGAHRILERRLPTHAETLQRFTVYLPGRLIEDAEALARLDGMPHGQAYCERALSRYLRAEVARRKVDADPPEAPADEDIDAMAGERAGGRDAARGTLVLRLNADEPIPEVEAWPQLPAPGPIAALPAIRDAAGESPAVAFVVRQACLDGGRDGWLGWLRRGEAAPAGLGQALLAALEEVEALLRGVPEVGRELAHALFRLAFESQVLLTDAWPELAQDASRVAEVHRVQESAERVLSGREVRYAAPGSTGGRP